MVSKRKILNSILSILIFFILFAACSSPNQSQETSVENNDTDTSLTKTETSGSQTPIVIDGKAEDWAQYDVIGNDEEGDQVTGSPDIGEVRGFSNDQYFYLMVRLHEGGQTDHYDVLMDVNGGDFDYQASVWPEQDQFRFAKFPVSGGMDVMDGGQAAQGEVIEVKVPLALMDGQPVRKVLVQTFLGDRTGDIIPDLRTQVTDEREVIGVAANKPPSTSPDQPAGQVCQGERRTNEPHYTVSLAGASAEMLWQTEFVPWWVRTGPDGKVYAVSDGSDAIYELRQDGTLVEAFVCPGMEMESAVMASDGTFWFAARSGNIYRATQDGTVTLMDQSGNRNLEAGPDGSVYAQENGLFRIDADGTKRTISQNAVGRKFAVSPDGDVVTLKDGKVYMVEPGGEMRELASGYGPEEWLTFSPDGKLYATHWSGVDIIDMVSGVVTPIPWLEDHVPGESGNFTAEGKLLVYHPNTHVFVIDLQKQTIGIYYQVISNSWALGVSPDSEVYAAFGNKQTDGVTTVYHVAGQHTLDPVFSVPYGNERSMTFGLDGKGYLAVADEMKGSEIYSFDPSSGQYIEYFKPDCWPETMATNPVDGRIWWGDCGQYVSLDANGQKTVIPGVPNGENSSLAITTEGEFYAMVFFHRDNPGDPDTHAIYHLNQANMQWEKVVDDTQSDPGITMAKITGCTDGKVYTVESLGPESLPIGRSSYNAVRRLENDGSLTLVGFDFAFDGQDVGCDYIHNQVIFTSGAGVFAVTVP